MNGSASANNDTGSYIFTKCKIVVSLALVLVVIQIYAVQRWQGLYLITTYAHKMERNLLYLDVQKPGEATTKVVENVTVENPPKLKDENQSPLKSNAYEEKQRVPGISAAISLIDEVKASKKNVSKDTEKPNPNHYTYAVRKYLELEDQLKKHLAKATDKKLILVWAPFRQVETPVKLDQTKCGNCEVTYDHDKISDERTGAVVLYFARLKKIAWPTPEQRKPKQLHIYWALESAATMKVVRRLSLEAEMKYQFNDTMTYRRDSGFYSSYEYVNFAELIETYNSTAEELLQQKNKLAVVVISDCVYTPGARLRMRMVKEIRSHGFPLDGFGGCFPGGRSFANFKHRVSEEFHKAVRKYKFYFSFENSFHCKDYITEKFFNNAMASYTVPVVWGAKREDYEAVAPRGSFIFAEDFSSTKELEDYLKYLDSNDTAYIEYLRWLTMKPEELPQYGRTERHCQICRALHGINIDDIYSPKFNESKLLRPLFSDGVAPRKIDNLIDWIYGEDNEECYNRVVPV